MKSILALIVGVIIGAVAVFIYDGNRIRLERITPTGNPQPTAQSSPVQPSSSPAQAAEPSGNSVQDKLKSLNLRAEDIKDELAGSGRVIRSKAQHAGQVISDATADARATTAIKGKLVADPDLSALSISVNTTEGVVTLSGTVDSEDRIGKAMLLALETDNVQQVISTLQVKPK